MTTPLSVWPDDTAIAATQSFGPFGPAWGGLRVPTILPLFPSLVATDAAVADWDTATEEDCEGQTDPLANVGKTCLEAAKRTIIHTRFGHEAGEGESSVLSIDPPASLPTPTHVLHLTFSNSEKTIFAPIHRDIWAVKTRLFSSNRIYQSRLWHHTLRSNRIYQSTLWHHTLRSNRIDQSALRHHPLGRRNHISLPIIRFTVPYQTLWPILYDYIYTSSTVAVLADLLKHQVPPSPFSAEPPEVQQYQMSALVAKLERIRRLWHNAAALGVEDEALWLVMARAWGVWLAELMEELEEPV
ncbi:hypothetical protein RTBOTA2_006957 [Rhodotorula toruloides]|nr:hypothetical protein RTBOTA2_006957 [Rhodotorula toruloides]